MNYKIYYYYFCVIFNLLFISTYFLIIHTEKLYKITVNIYQTLSFVNLIKIIIQTEIIRRLKNRFDLKKYPTIDYLLDLIKSGFFIYMCINYIDFSNNFKSIILMSFQSLNFIIMFLEFVYNLINHSHPQNNNRNTTTNIINQEIYINFENYLNIYIYNSNNLLTCPICLEDAKNNEEWTKLLCSHEFHYNCIKNWLNNNRTCPNCRDIILV
jgi:hypothetical protein